MRRLAIVAIVVAMSRPFSAPLCSSVAGLGRQNRGRDDRARGTSRADTQPPPQSRPPPATPPRIRFRSSMYHVVADPPAGASYPELYVSPAAFAGQIGWLARHGFHGVTLHDVLLHWQRGTQLPAHPVVVSFDDGYRSQAVTAAPILSSHGWPGVIDLTVRNTTDFLGLRPVRCDG